MNNQVYLGMAKAVSNNSLDRSTKVGCLILLADGTLVLSCNGFPPDVKDEVPERHERPAKYKWTEHAERTGIYEAAADGISLRGSVMYLPWYPCCDCARAIIFAGIKELVCYAPNFEDPKWGEDFKIAHQMFVESGVVETYEEPI